MVERITLSLPIVLLSFSLSLTHTHMTVHTPKPHLLPTSCNTTGSKPQKSRNSAQRREKYKTKKKRKRKGDTQEVKEWERVSERGDRRDRQGEKEGDDGYRWKVMARLETATHTHTHTHSRKRKTASLTFWPKSVWYICTIYDPVCLQNLSKTLVIRVFLSTLRYFNKLP